MTGASPNFGDRRGGERPGLIVIHYTAMQTCAEARERLCDPLAEVSAHWLISETGQADNLVPEDKRAWHAGAGSWAGRGDVNSRSIGIELANRGNHPFSEPLMTALEHLLAGIMARWSIPAHGVIGHSDMAPDRKADPGPAFDWRRLAINGLSVWPRVSARVADTLFRQHAIAFGYPDEISDEVLLRAFRLRFRPWHQGPLDGIDAAMAEDLAQRFPVDRPVA